MENSEKTLNKRFTVEITKAVPNTTDLFRTYTFVCGNYQRNSFDKVYNGALRITEACGIYRDNCDISIYGLRPEQLEELSFLVWNPTKEVDFRNTVRVFVDGVLIYAGNTYKVISDFTNAPNICLRIVGVVGTYISCLMAEENKDVTGLTIKEAFTALGNLAGFKTVVSSKISGNCPRIILQGSVRDQIIQLAKDLNLNFSISCNYLRVAPFNEVLGFSESDTAGDLINAKNVPEISNKNGLVGYPSFSEVGVNFKTIFDPTLKTGHLVDLYSIVPKVTGRHLITSKTTTLSTLPNGQWSADYTTMFIKSLEG